MYAAGLPGNIVCLHAGLGSGAINFSGIQTVT